MDFIKYDLPVFSYCPDPRRRWDLARYVAFRDGAYDVLNSALLENVKFLPSIGTYLITEDAGRPDMISHAIYRETQYWWLLMLYNNTVLPADFVAGQTINFFSLDALDSLFFRLSKGQINSVSVG